jgi:hypothetical protein
MAAYNKFNDFTEQLVRGNHQFGTHTYKIALTNTAPVATQTQWSLANHPAPVASNGYTAGGYTTTLSISESSGITTLQGTEITVAAIAGGIGPFRYAILYNDSVSDYAVAWADYASSITLNEGESMVIRFNNASPGTIFTLT